MNTFLRDFALTVIALAAGAFLFVWSGIYNIGADHPHLGIIRWLLQFGFRQSVEFHSRGIDPPSLDDPALVLRGAGHYEGGCAPCHGAPGRTRNPIALQMLPEPPYLVHASRWGPAELFWIVKHGIKYAGMPAWVAPERDDEVWAVVAFLQRLPELSPQEYRRLAFGEAVPIVRPPPENVQLLALAGPIGGGLAACARCHGLDGAGRGAGAFPRLGIQNAAYLYEALKSYAVGARPSGIMQPVAVELRDAQMRALAKYYAEIAPEPTGLPAPEPVERELLRTGEELATVGAPQQGVVACATCHGPVRNPLYPALAGQYADYTALQLKLFKAGIRDGPLSTIMTVVARQMTEEQIRAAALYYALIPPPEGPSSAPLAGAGPTNGPQGLDR